MNDPIGHTKKYQIPLNHLEHRYIQQCTDIVELEKIYKELISGQEGSHLILEQLTLDKIKNISGQPDGSIFSSIIKDHQNVTVNSIPATSVINNEHNRTVAKSEEDWEKFKENVSHEFNSDDEDKQSKNDSYESNKRLHMAEQHRLNADTAFKSTNYQQSIDLYTKSIKLEKNLFAYMNRAIAYYQLNNIDASIQDCFDMLSIDSNNINALSHRARCYLAKQQYYAAKKDLDYVLDIDSENVEAQDLLNTLLSLQKTTNTGDNEEQVKENFPSIDDQHHSINPFQNSSSNEGDDDEDEMALGDEAGAGLVGNLSDEDGHIARSLNVSPTMDEEDSDTQELLIQKPLELSEKTMNIIDHNIAFKINENNQQNHQINDNDNDDDTNDLYDYHNNKNSSSYKQNFGKDNNDISIQNSSIIDAIRNSNFGLIIQSWLYDLITLQSNRRFYDRPWSKSSRPWSLDKIQRDIEKFNRFNEYKNAIDVSKKMLQNGVLDYHYYAEYITETLIICAKSYLKLYDYPHAIQYASEALQYNKIDGYTLMHRAQAFENEKFLLFSYADYVRVPPSNFNYHLTQRAGEKLITELNSTEGETWREKLPNNQNDDERYLIYLKLKTNYSESNAYGWYQTHADQLYLDACFVLAIRFYTFCIQLQPTITNIYLKRAACYLKVFEPQKVIDDCDVILKDDKNNYLALYYKACAYKISRDYRLYELTLKEYIKLQPNNQIVLAEYYTYRHEQIPRKKRRIRTKSIDENILSYEELEQIRLEQRNRNSSLDSNDIKDQCSFILHSQSFNSITIKLIEIIINTSRLMIQIEENYQQEHQSIILPFSYIQFCFNILIQLTTHSQIDTILSMMDENYRILLDELISFYSSKFDDVEKLNRLKKL